MRPVQIFVGEAFEDGGATLLARVQGWNAADIVQSDISSIQYAVTDRTSGAAVISPTALTVSDVVFNTLQTDARWSVDAEGYNFRHTIPATALPTGDHVFRVEYKFTPASGEVFFLVFDVTAIGIYMS